MLQKILDWWRGYVRSKRGIIACGVWPTAVPPWADIFLDCCIDHDDGYATSEVLYAQGVVEQNQQYKDDALRIKQEADDTFVRCVKMRYSRSSFLVRPLARVWGEQYISLVLANGDRIWFSSIGVIIAEFESGDTYEIRVAMARAKANGTTQEEETIRHAHAVARGKE